MKFFLKIFIFVLPLSEAYAEGQKSAGLPQMDISTFPSQLFWLVVTFTALYLFMWKFVIPRLSTTIEERKDKISNDINDAENLNSEASKILENYDDKMNSASLESNEIVSSSKATMNEYLDKLKKDNEIKINAMITESEKKIHQQKQQSEQEIKKATIDTIKSIVSKYVETVPSDDEISKKLN